MIIKRFNKLVNSTKNKISLDEVPIKTAVNLDKWKQTNKQTNKRKRSIKASITFCFPKYGLNNRTRKQRCSFAISYYVKSMQKQKT